MNIRHQRHLATCRTHFTRNVFQIGSVNFGLRRDPHDLASRARQLQNFCHTRLGVACVRSDHRLHTNRVVAAHADVADHHFT